MFSILSPYTNPKSTRYRKLYAFLHFQKMTLNELIAIFLKGTKNVTLNTKRFWY